jgi:hypothetical protein
VSHEPQSRIPVRCRASNASVRRSEWLLAVCLLGVSAVGPWTVTLARCFGTSEFEHTSVVDMAAFMLRKIPPTLAGGVGYFVGTPVALLTLRAFCNRGADTLQAVLAIACEVVSVASVPLFWIARTRTPALPNAMADVLVADFVTMCLVHVGLVLGTGTLPAWTLAGGPLFGLSQYLRLKQPRPRNFLVALVALYINVGALYRGYRVLQVLGHEVFTQTVPLWEWAGYELYAAASVVGGFVLIAASIPPPAPRSLRGLADLADLTVFILLLNANIGAAWICERGVDRTSLVRSRRFVFR